MKQNVRIVFWGTSEFAIPSLEALLQSGYDVTAAVTNPDVPKGRKGELTPPPVKAWLMKHETWSAIPVLQPEKLDSGFLFHVSSFMSDVFVVASYGKIIPKEILEIPKYGALNIHPSLLPRWRGPSPIQYTILNGDTETGVTIIQMDEKMDHGPILANSKFKIQNSKITYPELHDMLAKLGAELLIETLPQWLAGEVSPTPQDELKATYCKILKKVDGNIDWKKSAEEIDRLVRAFTPWPGAYTFWESPQGKERLVVEEAEPTKVNDEVKEPGRVGEQDGMLSVGTGAGSLVIRQIRRAGGISLSAKDFLRGHRTVLGSILTVGG